jgi:hypothetical protein
MARFYGHPGVLPKTRFATIASVKGLLNYTRNTCLHGMITTCPTAGSTGILPGLCAELQSGMRAGCPRSQPLLIALEFL